MRRLLFVVLTLTVFLGFLGQTRVTGSHEERVVVTALSMVRSGWPWAARPTVTPVVELQETADDKALVPRADGATRSVNPWLIPVFHNEIRLQKPPLPYWATAVAFRVLGENAFAARAVPGLLGAFATLLLYCMARRVGGRRVAGAAALIWISSYFVVSEYRKAMADPYLAVAVLGAVWAGVRSPGTDQLRESTTRTSVLLFYAFLAMGALAKGPVVVLHVAVALAAFAMCFRRWPVGGRPRWHVIGVVGFLMVTLPWPAYVWSTIPEAIELWRYESVGEFADNARNARPWWYYLPAVLLLTLPWVLPWLFSVWTTVRRPTGRRLFPIVWLVLTVLIFSFVHMKKNAYLLPAMPALALGAAFGATRAIALSRQLPKPRWLRHIASVQTLMGLGLALVIAYLLVTDPQASGASGRFAVTLEPALLAGLLGSLLAIAIAARPVFIKTPDRFADWFTAQSVAFAVLILLLLAFARSERKNRDADDAFHVRPQHVEAGIPSKIAKLSLFFLDSAKA
jgi:4-amino-4-deoxy-L-arabinose transferase-like glycosyltransferase